MKKRGKKLLAGAAALAMSCSMVTGWANGVTITGVKVLSDPVGGTGEPTVAATYSAEQIAAGAVTLSTAQMLQVTVQLNNGAETDPAAAAGDVTFLSNINGETTLDNGTIQYVDQQTVSTADGTATITFRPRTTVNSTETNTNIVTAGLGRFVAKAGGTDVATTAEFNYTVVAPSVPLSASIGDAITEGDDAVITLTVPEGKNLPGAGTVTVKDGTNDATVKSYDNATGKLTVSGLTAGTHNLTISSDGYVSASVQVIVESAEVTIPEGDTGSVTTGIQNNLAGMTPSNGSVKLPTGTVTGSGTNTNYNVSYTVTTPDESKIVRGVDGTISLATVGEGENAKKVFAAKITVTASVGTTNPITSKKDIYLVADGTTQIAFGNLGLISTETGTDAFKTQANINALENDVKTELKANVLNYALDRRDHAADLGDVVKSAVDYDLNGDVTLSEYRMLKLMLEGTNGFTADAMENARATWISKAQQSSAE